MNLKITKLRTLNLLRNTVWYKITSMTCNFKWNLIRTKPFNYNTLEIVPVLLVYVSYYHFRHM